MTAHRTQVRRALCDDLNTPQVISGMSAPLKELNDLLHTKKVGARAGPSFPRRLDIWPAVLPLNVLLLCLNLSCVFSICAERAHQRSNARRSHVTQSGPAYDLL